MNSDWALFERTSPLVMETLRNAKSCGRMSHAYLVCTSNPEWRIKFPLLIFALMSCENPTPDFSPCGTCPSCRRILDGTFPDMFSLAPISKARKIQIGEDENDPDTMRWFEGLFHLSSMTECGWKFGIVHEAECLTEQAQNAFLKTLEEPPEKCAFVLTSGNPSLLLPTTRSRCQILRLTDSACIYRFPGVEQLPGILTDLLFGERKSLPVAGECASSLLTIANGLSETAEKLVNEKWKPKLDASENLDSTGKKLLEKRVNGEISCEYLRLRDEFLSCLHTFFAQAILFREGVAFELLPNKELFAPPFPLERLKETEIDYLYHILEFAEVLLRAMRTNANDDLAIRAFCLKAVFK